MPLEYYVKTGIYLPRTKKFFSCFCEAKKHIRSILAMRAVGLTARDCDKSIRVIRIDTEKMPDYRKIFEERDIEPAPLKKE